MTDDRELFIPITEAHKPTKYGPGNPPPEFEDERQVFTSATVGDVLFGGASQPQPSQQDQIDLDLLLWGNAYTVDGKRVDPTTVVLHRRTPQGEAEQVPSVQEEGWTAQVVQLGAIRTQEEFLTSLDELLDHTLHADECYCDPNDTTCVCVIGKVRAALPACEAEYPLVPGSPRPWHCVRTAHLASPDRHVWAPQ